MNFSSLSQTRTKSFRARVTKVYFSDKDSDFYIFQALNLDAGNGKNAKIKGYFFSPRIYPGVEIKVKGEWEKHPKYGYTFKAESYEPIYDGREAKEGYIAAQLPSVGPVVAGKIVGHFGEDEVFDILDNEPDALRDLDFLSDTKAEAIAREWRQARMFGKVSQALLGMGLPSYLVKSIYATLGEKTLDIIQNNPYELALVENVSFPAADKIALQMGFAPDSEFRIASLLEYLITVASEQRGHLYLNKSGLHKALNRMPAKKGIEPFGRFLGQNDVEAALKEREAKDRIVLEDDRVYLKWNYEVEMNCARMLSEFSDDDHDLKINTDDFIEEYQRIYKFQFSDEQESAIRDLNENKVLLVTGGPGTGKTTVSKALVRLFKQSGKKFKLMSPTGIAAKRLSTVVGEDAGTIHRTLGYSPDGSWKFNEKNKYVTDAVLIDEISMLDQNLMYHLLSALKPSTILVFVGDDNQLPSVGAGNVLHEMINSGKIHRVNLTEIFRQQGASDIVVNAHRIKQGKELLIGDPTVSKTDFRFIEESDPDKIVSGILHVVEKIYKGKGDATFQVFSPTYKGPLGVDILNEKIKESLNPRQSQREVNLGKGKFFREEDRIMIVENDYNLDVFNGEVGKIYEVDKKAKKIRTKLFDEPSPRLLDIPYEKAKGLLMLSYAVTIHRAQGQEYDYVIFPFHRKFSIQLQRNLLYTAVTRAKKKVFIFGEWSALRRAIQNDEVSQRNTAFGEKLRKLIK